MSPEAQEGAVFFTFAALMMTLIVGGTIYCTNRDRVFMMDCMGKGNTVEVCEAIRSK